jgi:integrase/recombinase XerD
VDAPVHFDSRSDAASLIEGRSRHARKGVPHLRVFGKGSKTRYPPLHAGTHALIHDYLDAADHGTDANGALFRPIRNNRTGRVETARPSSAGAAAWETTRMHEAAAGSEKM